MSHTSRPAACTLTTTKLQFLRARYYDPDQGRFTAKDTWASILTSPITQNAYIYANSDPSGHASFLNNIANGLKAVGNAIVTGAKAVVNTAKAVANTVTNFFSPPNPAPKANRLPSASRIPGPVANWADRSGAKAVASALKPKGTASFSAAQYYSDSAVRQYLEYKAEAQALISKNNQIFCTTAERIGSGGTSSSEGLVLKTAKRFNGQAIKEAEDDFSLLEEAKKGIKYIAEQLKPAFIEMRNNAAKSGPGVGFVSFSGSAIFSGGGTGSISITTDNKGNIAVLGTVGFGGGSTHKSFGGSIGLGQFPDAKDFHDLSGVGNQFGFSAGGIPITRQITGGYDWLVSIDKEGNNHQGYVGSVGLGFISPVPYEIHEYITNTVVLDSFNVYDVAEDIYYAIMNW